MVLPGLNKHQTTRWEVVKNSASPKNPFFVFRAILPIFRAFPLQIMSNHTFFSKGGSCSTYLFIFLLGHAHIWPCCVTLLAWGMTTDVWKMVDTCIECQRSNKDHHRKAPLVSTPTITGLKIYFKIIVVCQSGKGRTDWDLFLPALCYTYRQAIHCFTGHPPFELVFGREVQGSLTLTKSQWEGEEDAVLIDVPVTSLRSTLKQIRTEMLSKVILCYAVIQ